MTDPVDTDALREMLWRNGRRATVVTLDSDLIESAADEVDRLHAVIENAPHADDCCYLEEDVVEPYGTRISPHAHCTCWKADVL